MSSMRNAVQRRNHRERAQPEERQKWGLLEKHKDYSKRAKDFNEKKTKLKALRQKATERNPDEFYFGMLSRKGPSTAKGQNGTVGGDRQSQVLSVEAVRLFKTQDLGYVRTMRNKAAKEVEILKEQVTGIEGEGKRIVFLENEEAQRDARESNTDDTTSRPELDIDVTTRKNLNRQHEKQTDKLRTRLDIAQERLKSLTQAEEALDIQRAKMAKSPSIGGINKNGIKFKVRERKR